MATPETYEQIAEAADDRARFMYTTYGFGDPAVDEAVHYLHDLAAAVRRVAGIEPPAVWVPGAPAGTP